MAAPHYVVVQIARLAAGAVVPAAARVRRRQAPARDAIDVQTRRPSIGRRPSHCAVCVGIRQLGQVGDGVVIGLGRPGVIQESPAHCLPAQGPSAQPIGPFFL